MTVRLLCSLLPSKRFLRWQLSLILAALAASYVFLLPNTSQSSDGEPSVDAAMQHVAYTATIPGSKVRFEMAAIPGGAFLMGSAKDEQGRAGDEGPRHAVKIYPFWMGKREVTWDEYNLFRAVDVPEKVKRTDPKNQAVDAVTRPTPTYVSEYRGFGDAGYPVVGISHHAAMEYCRWLSLKTGKRYRLPTEAEWEYACRAGTKTAYSFGDDPDKLGDYAWYEKNAEETTHLVGGKKANPWGLFDMYGNVGEWCLDHYRKDYYRTFALDEVAIAPVRLPSEDRYSHVVRGGSWMDAARRCRSAARLGSDKSWNKIDPDKPKSIWWLWNADFVGFRIVRPVEEQQELLGLRSQVTKESK